MATKVYLIPEIGFVQVPDDGTREYLIPEGAFFNESVSDGEGEPPPGDPSYGGLFFCHG